VIGLAVEEAIPDPVDWLARLRRDFPNWGFLYDPRASLWVGVRGRDRIEMARTPSSLHQLMEARGARP
jgi:hypothetical protein